MPGRNATGRNTANSTSVVEMIGPVTCAIALWAASAGWMPGSSSMTRCTFSTTTIASSTTRPIARISANSVTVLAEKPKASSTAKTPISDTGMVSAGISVARQSCRKMKTTASTMMPVSISV